MLKRKYLGIILVTLVVITLTTTDAFGHGGLGIDRAPAIDYENRNVTVEVRMSPSDMTVGDFSNAFMTIAFLDDDTNELYKQTTYRVSIYKGDKLLANKMFYAENGKVTIDIRPDDKCSIEEIEPWRCTQYLGTVHPLSLEALYTLGENNPVIKGPIFTRGGMYHINVEVIGVGLAADLLDPLIFDVYIAIAQEQTFWIDMETGMVYDKPKHLR